MNKTFFALLIAPLFMIGCENNKFSLEGTLQDTAMFNGRTVYLSDLVNDEFAPFDSAVISNGTFSISTVCDSARVAFLAIETSPYDAPVVIPFVFEKGKMQLQITNDAFILGGTPQNDVLQQFAELETDLWQKLGNYKLQLQTDSTMADSARTMLYSNMEDLVNQEYAEKSFELVKQNANKPIGTYIFLNTYYYFKPDMIDAVLSLTDDKTKQSPKIQKIMSNNELSKSLQSGVNYIDFESVTPQGDTLALSALVGKTDYVLLDFWASWCPDCVAALPALKQIYEKNAGRLEILSVSLDSDREKWLKNGIEKFDLRWKHVSNLARWDDSIAQSYAVNSIPAMYLIDREGKIVASKASLSEIRAILAGIK
ncbi:MAG: AhpC/TSA family protein [Prevotellaceae bacterium]|jgi:thiol-disulfide isomerase/thioredoxin|nr:AhpC/TSA family protein [Prevotellaceae bacterium]